MNYELSDQVKKVLKAEKISEEELIHMVQASAPYTGDGMNRRYHQWLFKAEAFVVMQMRLQELRTVGIAGAQGWVEEDHDLCEGEGCRECGWIGMVRRYL